MISGLVILIVVTAAALALVVISVGGTSTPTPAPPNPLGDFATSVVESLLGAGKSADKDMGTKDVKGPCKECEEAAKKKKIKLVELVEVFVRGGKEGSVITPGKEAADGSRPKVYERKDDAGGASKQFINLKKDLEGAGKERPDYGEYIEVRARVEWDDGKRTDLAGKTVHFKLVTTKGTGKVANFKTAGGGTRGDLDASESQGFEGHALNKDKTTATTDEKGWTGIVKVYLSKYGGDKFTVKTQADVDGSGKPSGPELSLGDYVVWRKFWYQVTQPLNYQVKPLPEGQADKAAPKKPDLSLAHTCYQKVCADMVPAPAVWYTEATSPPHTFYPQYMVKVGGTDDKETVIGAHNKAPFRDKFDKVTNKDRPTGHLVICENQWDPSPAASDVKTIRVTKNNAGYSDQITMTLSAWNAGIVKPALKGDLIKTAEWQIPPAKRPKPEEPGFFQSILIWLGISDPPKAIQVEGKLKEENIDIAKSRTGLNAVRIKLPPEMPDVTKYHVEVTLELNYGLYYAGESSGWQILIVYEGVDKQFSETTSHELGHAYFQCVPSGKQPTSLKDHPLYYTKHGGVGPHCKHNVTEQTDAAGNKVLEDGLVVYIDGDCAIFHQVTNANKSVWCEECEPYLKLQDMAKMGDPS